MPLYVISIEPFCPGAIGRLSYLGIVQPQLAITSFITKGAFPTFRKSKIQPFSQENLQGMYQH